MHLLGYIVVCHFWSSAWVYHIFRSASSNCFIWSCSGRRLPATPSREELVLLRVMRWVSLMPKTRTRWFIGTPCSSWHRFPGLVYMYITSRVFTFTLFSTTKNKLNFVWIFKWIGETTININTIHMQIRMRKQFSPLNSLQQSIYQYCVFVHNKYISPMVNPY